MSIFKIPRTLIQSKLTEFISECQNDLALTAFLSQVLDVKTAHNTLNDSKQPYMIIYSGEEKERYYSAKEIVERILSKYDELDFVREQVMAVKGNYKFKERVNLLEMAE